MKFKQNIIYKPTHKLLIGQEKPSQQAENFLEVSESKEFDNVLG